MIWRNQELGFQFLQNSNFAIARRKSIDGRNFASRSIVFAIPARCPDARLMRVQA
jgi:hypothetical protein